MKAIIASLVFASGIVSILDTVALAECNPWGCSEVPGQRCNPWGCPTAPRPQVQPQPQPPIVVPVGPYGVYPPYGGQPQQQVQPPRESISDCIIKLRADARDRGTILSMQDARGLCR
ncbi:hypothetical protein [Aliterella atlantica]|uniref:Uncharacterized protein n=1 Tax=Aliterella atlantica CENA595 TaxID=1618023 RepID=A0A0D8ZLN6_9CYAN|nr:hypothetical protein [Aliterella atlantica]KJH69655.1 hypothetical protein UH38_22780 [Aliterella atlantica CENA595]